jgi:hypothetical protein
MDWDPSNQNDTVPQELYYIKLMKYDVDNPRDIIAASMYFNTMSSKAEFDTYIDRVMQAKALIKVYNEDLENNRIKTCRALHEEQAAKRAEGGRVKTVQKRKGKVLHTEVVEWLGINAGLLCDGDGFSKSKIALGVLCRIASLVPDELLTWMQTYSNHEFPEVKNAARAVLQQRYLSPNDIWTKNTVSSKTCLYSCTHTDFACLY